MLLLFMLLFLHVFVWYLIKSHLLQESCMFRINYPQLGKVIPLKLVINGTNDTKGRDFFHLLLFLLFSLNGGKSATSAWDLHSFLCSQSILGIAFEVFFFKRCHYVVFLTFASGNVASPAWVVSRKVRKSKRSINCLWQD